MSRICECCERRQQPGEQDGWAIDGEGSDFCPECWEGLRQQWQRLVDELPDVVGICPEGKHPMGEGEVGTCPECGMLLVPYFKAKQRITVITPYGPAWIEEYYPDWTVIDSDDGMTMPGGTSYLLERQR